MPSEPGFRSVFAGLWFRMMMLGMVALVFTEGLVLSSGEAQGWTFYLTSSEVAFEVLVRVVVAALAGMGLGTVCAAALAPFLVFWRVRRERFANTATKVAVVLMLFVVSRYALQLLIKMSYKWIEHRVIFDWALLAAHFMAFAIALVVPRARKELTQCMDGALSEKMTRRAAMVTVAGTVALVATEYALSKTLPVRQAISVAQRPKSNFLLITFDALSAEDMSLYGWKLPTTPNIDAFARKSTVFTKFYSASTFTTPAVATLMTGLFPSESLVYHLEGTTQPADIQRSLPHQLRERGYATGAFVTNPYAYYYTKTLDSEFDALPEPDYPTGRMQDVWHALGPLHQNSGFGNRMDEYHDLEDVWSSLWKVPNNLSIRYRPRSTFEQTRQILSNLPDGFFLWAHVITPHHPYLPDRDDRNRFLPDEQRRSFEEEFGDRWQPHYPASQQNQIDLRRLAYDEFVATADRAFGAFISDLEASGKLRNTTVVVSADHGESFEGGVFQHRTPYLTRPVVHVPLMIRTPGQQDGRTVAVTADQTSLPPTILELAGLPKPDTMRGPSLVPWLTRNGQGEGEGLAYTQYFDRSSIFRPLRRGSVGVIDSQFEYVVYLQSQKGELRPLAEAQVWNLDCSAEHPERAKALREALSTRFPELVRKDA